jgi:riboflavin synthase
MFTGIIESVGTLLDMASRGNYRVLTIRSSLASQQLQAGESISCDGACLTVVGFTDEVFTVEASQETTARTILSGYRVGDRINLERALRADSRLGGHFVSGHVDDVGQVNSVVPVGESIEIGMGFDPEFDRLVVEKGSIAVSGISLTVNRVQSGWFSVNIIPYTQKDTTITQFRPGSRVNLEFDLIGKYVIKMQSSRSESGLTKSKLIDSGW